jgi:putative lipoic acid-binding regulatory protein
MSNRFIRDKGCVPETQKVEYPATFHFRVIVEPAMFAASELDATLASYRVTEALAASRGSSAGRYQAYSVSVEIRSRDELHAFDAAVRKVPGVRMMV